MKDIRIGFSGQPPKGCMAWVVGIAITVVVIGISFIEGCF